MEGQLGYTRLTVEGRKDLGGVKAIIKVGSELLDTILEKLKTAVASKADASALEGKADVSAVAAKLDISCVAPEYSEHATYDTGIVVIHEGKIYERTTAVETSEPFDAENWTEKYLIDIINGEAQTIGPEVLPQAEGEE